MRFGGHETFPVREGWLTKGLRLIENDPKSLDAAEAADQLGVGRNMVKSIRHWLLVTGLTARPKRQQPMQLTSLGQLILELDPYMIELASWWALHANLVIHTDKAVSWSWFFNTFGRDRFDRLTCVDHILRHVAGHEVRPPSRDTLNRDVQCLLSSYAASVPPNKEDPEEGLDSPFRELGLVTHYTESDTYLLSRGAKSVPPAALAYAIALRYGEHDGVPAEIPVAAALAEPGGPGRVFALDGDALSTLIDTAKDMLGDDLGIKLLGGERIVYLKERSPEAWLADHFAQEVVA
jgi:hypothetical protein